MIEPFPIESASHNTTAVSTWADGVPTKNSPPRRSRLKKPRRYTALTCLWYSVDGLEARHYSCGGQFHRFSKRYHGTVTPSVGLRLDAPSIVREPHLCMWHTLFSHFLVGFVARFVMRKHTSTPYHADHYINPSHTLLYTDEKKPPPYR